MRERARREEKRRRGERGRRGEERVMGGHTFFSYSGISTSIKKRRRKGKQEEKKGEEGDTPPILEQNAVDLIKLEGWVLLLDGLVHMCGVVAESWSRLRYRRCS